MKLFLDCVSPIIEVNLMSKYIASFLILFTILITACGPTGGDRKRNEHPPSIVQSTALPPPEVERKEGDFIYKLYTEKGMYDEYEDTSIIAELTYVGDEETIEIFHAETPLTFALEERTRNVKIETLIRDIGVTSKLKKDVPLIKKYTVTKGHVFEDDKASVKFFKTVKKKGLPDGEYIIHGFADFSDKNKHYTINGEIGFTVIK